MKKISVILATLLLTTALSASSEEKVDRVDSVVKESNDAAKLLLGTMKMRVMSSMKSGGVVAAANVCIKEAYPITDSINKTLKSGMSIKRISNRYRNPANKPSEDEKKILDSLDELVKNGTVQVPYILTESKDSYKLYKPLMIDKPICIKCHGDISKDNELSKILSNTYPDDKSLNHKMGDIRGAVVVTTKK
jgi:hypothetical protein